MPIRTGNSSVRCAATAERDEANPAHPRYGVLEQPAPCASIAPRSTKSCAASATRMPSASASHRRVALSTSVNKNVGGRRLPSGCRGCAGSSPNVWPTNQAYLQVRSPSFRFSSARYLRFCFRALTGSRVIPPSFHEIYCSGMDKPKNCVGGSSTALSSLSMATEDSPEQTASEPDNRGQPDGPDNGNWHDGDARVYRRLRNSQLCVTNSCTRWVNPLNGPSRD